MIIDRGQQLILSESYIQDFFEANQNAMHLFNQKKIKAILKNQMKTN